MAEGLKPMPLDLPKLKWESFDPARFVMDYDKTTDILYVRPPKARAATSVDLDEDVWLRVDLATGEIVGFEIDDFELVFLKKHPELAAPWHEIRPKAPTEKMALVLAIFLEFLRSLASPHPQQPRLEPRAI